MAIDCLGARLGRRRLPTAPRGYESLHCWASGLGEVVAFGIEGTGSYGAGLTRYLGRSWPDCHRGQPARQVYTPQGGKERPRRCRDDRIRAGVDRAAAEGRTGGRPPALSSEKVEAVKSFLGNGGSVSAAARTFGVSRPTARAISRSRTPCPLWLRGCRPAAQLLLEGPRSVGPAALARGVHRADAELPAIGMGRSFVPERVLLERLFGEHSL